MERLGEAAPSWGWHWEAVPCPAPGGKGDADGQEALRMQQTFTRLLLGVEQHASNFTAAWREERCGWSGGPEKEADIH